MSMRKRLFFLQGILVGVLALSSECWARQDIFGISFPLCRNTSDCGNLETLACHWCDIHLTVSGPIDNGPITFQFISRSEDDSLRILSKSDLFTQDQTAATYKMEDLIQGFGSTDGWVEIVVTTRGRQSSGAHVNLEITDPSGAPYGQKPFRIPGIPIKAKMLMIR
jgi:hypothetical protein